MSKQIKIIFLNGVGSVGKTSIAKALQVITQEPFLHVGIDHFIEMLPEKYINSPEGLLFESSLEDGNRIVKISIGKVGAKLFTGMRHAIAALAAQGNNLIIDEVLIGDGLEQYEKLLTPFEVFYVGVYAPLAVIEERELARGDRLIGLARWQYDIVHQNKTYDLEVDTTELSALNCAELIKSKFNL